MTETPRVVAKLVGRLAVAGAGTWLLVRGDPWVEVIGGLMLLFAAVALLGGE